MTDIDPDSEPQQGGEEQDKRFGELARDATHDLKEDAKDIFRRGGDEDEDGKGEDEDSSER
jgi:hypothetical protein